MTTMTTSPMPQTIMTAPDATVTFSDQSPNTRKRSYEAMASPATIVNNTPATNSEHLIQDVSPTSGLSSSRDSNSRPASLSRQASPALSATSTSLTSISATPPPPDFGMDDVTPTPQTTTTQPPAKRRKLTFTEKEQRRQEKEQRDKERAEEKARKEAEKSEQKAKKDGEKQVKDEERRQKNEQKEEKRREKELEKLKKDEEKRRLDEEKLKKERAQSRITFFAKPQTPVKSRNASGSTAPNHVAFDVIQAAGRTDKKSATTILNDYRKTFLPYALPSNTTVARTNIHVWDDAAKEHMQRNVLADSAAGATSLSANKDRLVDVLDLSGTLARRPYTTLPTVKQLIMSLSGSQSNPIDLDGLQTLEDPMAALQEHPIRILQFAEDIRPPYIGTYSKPASSRLPRNPYLRERQDTDYDYDSEAEWEEPDEGDEDLEVDGESDVDTMDGEDDMAEFLDDEGADRQPIRRRLPALAADLDPKSSGLCFEDAKGLSRSAGGVEINMMEYRLELLLDIARRPIDPFSEEYWPKDEPVKVDEAPVTTLNIQKTSPDSATPTAQSQPLKNAPVNVLQGASVRKKNQDKSVGAPKLLSGPELEAFKSEVQDSEHNKTVLLGLLKKRFPKASKAVLADTLGTVAARVGRHEADKRWVLIQGG